MSKLLSDPPAASLLAVVGVGYGAAAYVTYDFVDARAGSAEGDQRLRRRGGEGRQSIERTRPRHETVGALVIGPHHRGDPA
jgi:hypothetical protein